MCGRFAVIGGLPVLRFPLDVLADEIINVQAHGAGRAIRIIALEIHGLLAADELARFIDHESVDGEIGRRPCVEDNALALQAILIGEARPALDPILGLVSCHEAPARKSVHVLSGIDHEAVMATVDLAGKDARPVAELEIGEGRFCHQMRDGKSQCGLGQARPEDPERSMRLGDIVRHDANLMRSRERVAPWVRLVKTARHEIVSPCVL